MRDGSLKKKKSACIFALILFSCSRILDPNEPVNDWNRQDHELFANLLTDRYFELANSQPAADARQQLIREFKDEDDVSDMRLGLDETSIWYDYQGRRSVYQTFSDAQWAPPGAARSPRISFRPSVLDSLPCPNPKERKALVLMVDERTAENRKSSSDIVQSLAAVGYEATLQSDPDLDEPAISLSAFEMFDQYGIVILMAQAVVDPEGFIALPTGAFHDTQQDSTYADAFQGNEPQLVLGHTTEDPRPRYFITPSWMEARYPDGLSTALVLLAGSFGLRNTSFSSSIASLESQSMVYGWDQRVDYFDSIDRIIYFLDLLPYQSSRSAFGQLEHKGLSTVSYADPSLGSWTTTFREDGVVGSLSLNPCPELRLIFEAGGVNHNGSGYTYYELNGVRHAFRYNASTPGYLTNFIGLSESELLFGRNTIYFQAGLAIDFDHWDNIYDDFQIADIRIADGIGNTLWEDSGGGPYHLGDHYDPFDPNPPEFWAPLIGLTVTVEFDYPFGDDE